VHMVLHGAVNNVVDSYVILRTIFLSHEDEPHFSLRYSFLWNSKDEQMS
jgi:hypothetical protein